MDITQESVESFLENKDDIDYLIEVIANRVLFGKRTGDWGDWHVEKLHWLGDTLRVNLTYHYRWNDCADYDEVEFPVDLIWKEDGLDEALRIGNKRAEEKKKKEEEAKIQEQKEEKEKQRIWDLEECRRLENQLRRKKEEMEKADK